MNPAFLRVRAFNEHFVNDTISLYVFIKYPNQNMKRIKNIEMEEVTEMSTMTPSDSIIHVEPTAAQELMDDLWQCGIRPTEGTGSAGAMQAKDSHIKDLQEFGKRLLALVEKTV